MPLSHSLAGLLPLNAFHWLGCYTCMSLIGWAAIPECFWLAGLLYLNASDWLGCFTWMPLSGWAVRPERLWLVGLLYLNASDWLACCTWICGARPGARPLIMLSSACRGRANREENSPTSQQAAYSTSAADVCRPDLQHTRGGLYKSQELALAFALALARLLELTFSHVLTKLKIRQECSHPNSAG